MAQWFKKLRFIILRLIGVPPMRLVVAIGDVEETISRGALAIRAYYKDEGVQAVLQVCRAQQTRNMYALSSFGGDAVKLARMQGQIETITNLINFIESAGSMPAENADKLRKEKQDAAKTRILKFGSTKTHNDVVI